MALSYLCGYDGTLASRRAVEFTAHLSAAAGARALAVTVAVEPARWQRPAFEADARVWEAAEEVARGLDVEGVETTVVGARSPARGLHEAAVRRHAALLAIGVEHRGALGRLRPGAVAHHLVQGAPCAVAVVPDEAPGAIATVGVAYQRTVEGQRALEAGEALARDLGARLVVLTVFDAGTFMTSGPTFAYATSPELVARARAAVHADARRAAAACRVPDGVEVRLLEGAPGPALVAAGEQLGLLVAGSRSFGPVRTVLLGSVSHRLAEHAPCPVVLVPRAAPTLDEGVRPEAVLAGAAL